MDTEVKWSVQSNLGFDARTSDSRTHTLNLFQQVLIQSPYIACPSLPWAEETVRIDLLYNYEKITGAHASPAEMSNAFLVYSTQQ